MPDVKGLTATVSEERAVSGRRSLKVEATLNGGSYFYHWLPVRIPLSAPLKVRGRLWREALPEAFPKVHAKGYKVWVYGRPIVGEEAPTTYRRNYGLMMWKQGEDGAYPYTYQANQLADNQSLYDDFNSPYGRVMAFTYPTMNGVLDTVQWEGFRESNAVELKGPLLTHTVDPQWQYLANHPRVVGIVEQLLGGNPMIVQSMYLDKPTGGQGIALHQDLHFIRNEPNTLMAC